MAIHTRLQLDPRDTLNVRKGDGAMEIVALDSDGEGSAVIELTAQQLAAICEAASEL